jgi:hypothetical protein
VVPIDSWFHHSISEGGSRPAALHRAAGRVTSGSVILGVLAALCLTSPAWAQNTGAGNESRVKIDYPELEETADILFKSAADSLEWENARTAAHRARGLRVVVSLRERRVFVMRGADTIRSTKAAVASGMTINFAGRSWTFRTPRGKHTVLRKVKDPVWRPPDWLYAEAAMEHDLQLARLSPNRPVRVNRDESLVVRNGRVGLLSKSTGRFAPLPTDEHIVFNDTLYIPPLVTENRKVEGELGRFALDLGDGYLIHGSPDPNSIGRAVTHGCIRLGDFDIAWLHSYIPVGTPVYIY